MTVDIARDEQGQSASPRITGPSLAGPAFLLYLAMVLILLLRILHRDHGVFTYTLDDPYIHLALADSIAHGHYGINPGEASSPSSTVLWPFLLVPFAREAWFLYVPLAFNLIFCGFAAALIGRTVERWNWSRFTPDMSTATAWLVRFAAVILLMLVSNLVGLTFVGMEHGLQVLLAIACAAGITEVLAGHEIPAWCLAAAALGPMVRYENFALTAAVAIALYGSRRGRAAGTVVCLSLVGPILFSLFLISNGLPALPSSVLVKARAYGFSASFGMLLTPVMTMFQSLFWAVTEVAWYLQVAVFLVLVRLTRRETRYASRAALYGASCAALLQLLVGRYNWFYRYEVYALSFTVLVACAGLLQTTRVRLRLLFAGLSIVAAPYAFAVYRTPDASANVYQQQYQMHRFLAKYKGSAVAVNDLGQVSFGRSPGLYVLDLWGLASPEAARHPTKNAEWLAETAHAHHAGLAIIYPDWYAEGAPDEWLPLGTMCIGPRHPTSIAERCVVFYSTPDGDYDTLERQLADFAPTLPATVSMTLGVDSTDTDNNP